MAIRNEDGVLTPIQDAPERGITKQMVVDLIESQFGVGGYMACEDVTNAEIPNAWAPFSWFDFSSDTKGVNETLADGLYTVTVDSLNNTPDAWMVDFSAGLVFNFDGWVEFAVIKNAGQPGQQILRGCRRRRDFTNGDDGSLDIVGGGAFANGDTCSIICRSSGAGPGDLINIRDAAFRFVRP